MRFLLFFALFTLYSAPDIQIIVYNQDQKTLDFLRFIQEKLPDKHIEIKSESADSLWQKTVKGVSGNFSKTSSGLMKSKNIVSFLFKFFIGGSSFSYLTILYLIYRVYKIIKKINGFMYWWGGSDDEEGDVVQEIDRIFFKSRLGSIKETYIQIHKELITDYNTLLLYKKLDTILRWLHIRKLFPGNEITNIIIDEKLSKLALLQMYTKKRVHNLC